MQPVQQAAIDSSALGVLAPAYRGFSFTRDAHAPDVDSIGIAMDEKNLITGLLYGALRR